MVSNREDNFAKDAIGILASFPRALNKTISTYLEPKRNVSLQRKYKVLFTP
jgi:hypothetical protein